MSNYAVYQPTKACARCKGNCCKTMPGHYAPSDFSDLSFDGLKAEIEKGGIAIDWWNGPTKEYYLRARHFGEDIVHGSWGGICVNLSPTGCRLSWEDRPLGCKALKPHVSKYGECKASYTKEQCKNEWKPYLPVLEELVSVFGEKEENPYQVMFEFLDMMSRLVDTVETRE